MRPASLSTLFRDRTTSPPPPPPPMHRHASSQSSVSENQTSSPTFSTRNGSSKISTPVSSVNSVYNNDLPALQEYALDERWSQDIAGGRPNTFYGAYEHGSWEEDGHFAKRRRSDNTFTSRLVTRLPSLSKRTRERKRSSIATIDFPASQSPPRAQSPIATPEDHQIDTIVEDDRSQFAEGLGITDFESRVPTPLMHPLMDNIEEGEPVQSPLHSPTIESADSPLSMRRSGSLVHDVPPILIADSSDQWAEKLGHANFEISPEPYSPVVYNAETCQQLLQDWERARSEFAKHLSRTQTHFGVGSKTFIFTQEKWAFIDAQWRQKHEAAVAEAVGTGDMQQPQSPAEPAPVAKIPDMDNSKFPGLGDNDLVKPMTQVSAVAPIVQRRPSKRAQLLQLIKRPFLPARRNQIAV